MRNDVQTNNLLVIQKLSTNKRYHK